jgi:hypothetical protein
MGLDGGRGAPPKSARTESRSAIGDWMIDPVVIRFVNP